MLIPVPPERRDELQGLAGQVGLAETVMAGLGYGSGRTVVVTETDPEAIERDLYRPSEIVAAEVGAFRPVDGKRSLMRQVLGHLHAVAPAPVDHLFLPPQAPFGAAKVDVEGCTLCLACVGSLPDRRAAGQSGDAGAPLPGRCLHPVRSLPHHLSGIGDHAGTAPNTKAP